MRVTFVRGRLRVVLVPSFSSSLLPRLVVSVLAVSLLVVSVLDEGVSPGDRSVVCGRLVVVIVAVVVAGDVDDAVWLDENEGSTKLSGAWSGLLNSRIAYVAARMTRPIATRPSALAPINAGVRLCHGGSDDGSGPSSSESSESSPATATDSSLGDCSPWVVSTELRDDVLGEELDVVEVRHIQELQVNALNADLPVGAEFVGDLSGRADGR